MLKITDGKIKRAQKVVLYGSEGIGKSTFAAKFPNPLFIDTEGGTSHMDVRRIEQLKGAGNEFIGSRTRVKIVKNKVAPPFKEAEFDIMYGEGISREGELLDMGIKLNVVQKSGSWLSYGPERLGQGRDRVKELLKNDPELTARIERDIKEATSKLAAKEKDLADEAAKKAPAAPAPKKEIKTTIDIDVED